jgi:regulator of protease activity HflC (stomatin/prohibitin superfamily)
MVSTSEVGIIERFGKFNRTRGAGCVFVCCPFEIVAGVVSLRIQQLDVVCETKTLDNVFVMVNCSVQFNVIKGKENQSFYYSLSKIPQASY